MRVAVISATLFALANAWPGMAMETLGGDKVQSRDTAYGDQLNVPLVTEVIRLVLTGTYNDLLRGVLNGTDPNKVYSVYNANETVRTFVPPGPGDVRGPCPMCNTWANHGYIPHDGKNLDMETLAIAAEQSLHTSGQLGILPAAAFIAMTGLANFSLADLSLPQGFRYNASLTREDQWNPDDPRPLVSPSRIQALLNEAPGDHINPQSLAKSRLRVEAMSPRKLDTVRQAAASLESGLLLFYFNRNPVPPAASMAGHEKYQGDKEWLKYWLLHERFPTELGWDRSKRYLPLTDSLPILTWMEVFKNMDMPGSILFDFLPGMDPVHRNNRRSRRAEAAAKTDN